MNKILVSIFILVASCTSKESNNKSSIDKVSKELERQNQLLSKKNKKIDELEKRISKVNSKLDSLSINNDGIYNITKLTQDFREHIQTRDTLQLIAFSHVDDEYNHVFAFINSNKNSKYHQMIKSGYTFNDNDDRKQYLSYFKNHEHKDKNINSNFIGNWKPIYRYNFEYYNYLPLCEFINVGFSISDSALVNYYMDGLYPSIIEDVLINTNDKLEFKSKDEILTLQLLDEKREIYLFKRNNRNFQYIIPQHAISNFPIIVEDCHEEGGNIIKFGDVLDIL